MIQTTSMNRPSSLLLTSVLVVLCFFANQRLFASVDLSQLAQLSSDNEVQVRLSRGVFNRRTGEISYNLDLANLSSKEIKGPFFVEVVGLPVGVTVAETEQVSTSGNPVLFLELPSLPAGGSSASSLTLSSSVRTRLEFLVFVEPLFSISGVVVLGAGELGSGVSVTAVGPTEVSVQTDTNGAFELLHLPRGNYTVAPRKVNAEFVPTTAEVELSDQDVSGLLFEIQASAEGLSQEQLEVIDELPTELTPANEIILPNGETLERYLQERGIEPDEDETGILSNDVGTGNKSLQRSLAVVQSSALPPAEGPQQRKNDVIAKMLAQARFYACGKEDSGRCTRWDFPADSTDENAPAQRGLNYVYGSKSVSQRNQPVDSCSEKTYGFDCSGLIHKVAASAGISIPVGSANRQGNPNVWGIPAAWNLQMIEVTDGSKETGDILVWNGHIGIATGGGRFISALGAPNDCTRNLGPKRGPRSITISGFGRPVQKRLRLVSNLAGNYDMPIRCAGNPQLVGTVRFPISNEGGPFTSSGSGTDLNGTPLCFNLNGNYDISRNTLNGQLALCDNSRVDGFSVELLTDRTDFFALSRIVNNGGCPGEARFIRVSDGLTPNAQKLPLKPSAAKSPKPDPSIGRRLRYGGPPF